MRRGLALLILSIFLLQGVALAEGDIFRGHAEFDDQYTELDKELYTGKMETLEKRDTIEMTVSQVIDGSFSFEGDEFFAQVTSDVIGDKGVIIPKGTVAHGSIKDAASARRLGRDGYIDLSFDYLVTPDGREIPIEGKMSTRLHPIKSAAKIVATDVGYTTVGGVVGGMFALQALGIEAAIASNGWTVAGGAAVGGAVGLGMSLYRKGKDVLIAPGDEIKVKISIKTTDKKYVSNIVVTDLLPGGLSIISGTLNGTFDSFDIREDRILIYTSVGSETKEFSYDAKAVASGNFVLPAVEACHLYDLNRYAVSSNSVFKHLYNGVFFIILTLCTGISYGGV